MTIRYQMAYGTEKMDTYLLMNKIGTLHNIVTWIIENEAHFQEIVD